MRRHLALASAAIFVVAASTLFAAAGEPARAASAARGAGAQAAQVAAGSGFGPAAVLAGMTEAQRVGQLFMAGVPATGPVSSAIRSDITRYQTGSVILTGRSGAGVTATRELTSQLQGLATVAATDGVPLFVATDQEGGNVQVLSGPGFSTMPTALSQGSESVSQLQHNSAVWAGQLAAAGVNLDLAPVLDTVPANVGTANKPIGFYYREYGYTPTAVTTAGTAFVEGMREAGVSVAVKHFPGLGRASGNTDNTYGVTDNVTTYNDPYLQPYSAAVRSAGAQVVMVSEAEYTKIDAHHAALFSPTVLGGMLRSELGFHGLIMSDSMDTVAMEKLAPAQRAVDFISAGGQLVLATNPGDIPAMRNAVLTQAEAAPSFAALVSQAALNVLIAKQQTGVIGGTVAAAATSGEAMVIERANGGSVAEFTQTGGTWSGPVLLGGTTYYQPAATAVPGSTRTYAAIIGPNGQPYLLALNSGSPASAWTSLGGKATAPPGLAAGPGGKVALAVRGTNHAIYVKTYTAATSWSAYTNIGGVALDAPIGVAYTPSGDLDVFVTGTNEAVYVDTLHAGVWSGFKTLGGQTVGGPVAVTVPGGPVEVFMPGASGVPYERTYSSRWSSAWVSLGAHLSTSLAAASPASGTSWVVADGTTGSLFQDTTSSGSWSGWQALPFG